MNRRKSPVREPGDAARGRAEARGTATDATHATRTLTSQSRRILVVDDNRDIADVLAQLLRKRGHLVEVAYDGPGALERARKFRPRVALMDLGLPVMDGYELARRMKSELGTRQPVMLALSGYGRSSDQARALTAGYRELLLKPLDLERVFRLVEAA